MIAGSLATVSQVNLAIAGRNIVEFSGELLSSCWFLAGPTACGKTAVSLRLAQKINAEIIALDSMTLYRGMDIGTAKATPEQQAIVPHHLINVLDPNQDYSLSEYVSAAEGVCREIVGRGRTPLFVGGTGLYLRGVLRGVFEGPPADWSLRSRFEALSTEHGPRFLHDRLSEVDPEAAARLHPNDQRRIIRALEVFELLGQPLSNLQRQGPLPLGVRPRQVYWLSPPRDWLYKRIDDRVRQMFAEGLVDEVRRLTAPPHSLSQTARQALGYKEVIDWLESIRPDSGVTGADTEPPKAAVEDLITLIQMRTRQFAKRQQTWFRNLEECHAVAIEGSENVDQITEKILSMNP
ncbi:tRNA (adenosine(37)-N6)-dimethylallyltransferase MiaA [Schlesneria sp. DSM 10557]|uniref:tRNA (adenosine(37)-N6)-dimethylallyltransferase MiaA n=1 Tax=Schlesneria sp. DSM 10557 TaxID=3044399 RepID=UPI0035C81684